MADISVQKNGGADLSKIWAAAAIIAILALMGWLMSMSGSTSSTTAATSADTDTTEVETPAGEAVELSALGAAPDQYVGRTIQTTVPVSVPLGSRGFWADIPGANPFLTIVGPEVADVSWVTQGGSASVVGTVQPVTDAEVEGWISSGAIQPEARDQAAFATYYLSVSSATPQ